MKPPQPILDPAFRHLPSYATDIRKTFKRLRRRLPQHRLSPAACETVAALKKRG
jgi:hypothetical protein